VRRPAADRSTGELGAARDLHGAARGPSPGGPPRLRGRPGDRRGHVDPHADRRRRVRDRPPRPGRDHRRPPVPARRDHPRLPRARRRAARHPRGARDLAAAARVRRADGPRALDVAPDRDRPGLDPRVLRHLPLLPEHQELPAAGAARALRLAAARLRAHAVRHGPGDLPAPGARHRLRRAHPLHGLPALPDLRADLARLRARVVDRHGDGHVVGHRAEPQLGAGGAELLPDPVARPDLRGARALLGAPRHGGVRPAGRAARGAAGVPAQPGRQRRAAEHRGLRLAPRGDRVHGRADRPPAARPAGAADRHVGLPRAHRPRHDLLRLALRGRRHRRRRHRAHRGLRRRPADRLAHRARRSGARPAAPRGL
ncbi:MAG: hypothetical protein AVDCRST_MAG30-2415, partial [uncultured Solirubrobacteraceae bacterium]